MSILVYNSLFGPNDPDVGGGELFGQTVACRGNDVFVGCPSKYTSGDNAWYGAVYYFQRGDNGLFSFKQKIEASDKADGDWFGSSISVSGDQLLIGAPYKNDNRGAAYLFTRSGPPSAPWQEANKLHDYVWLDLQPLDFFGKAVCASGDYDLFVGSPGKKIYESSLHSGRVWIFAQHGPSVDWSFTHFLDAPEASRSGAIEDLFGANIYTTVHREWYESFGDRLLLISDHRCDAEGYVYVYAIWNGNWIPWQRCKRSDPSHGGRLSASCGSVANGYVAWGAPNETNFNTSDGTVYIWNINTAPKTMLIPFEFDDLTESKRIPVPSIHSLAGGQFGYSVSIDEQLLLIGAVGGLVPSTDGKVLLYEKDWNGERIETSFVFKEVIAQAHANSLFGNSVMIDCDSGIAAIGAPYEDVP
jgi:hypothetical protein